MDCKADKLSNSGHLGNQIVDQSIVPNEIYTARRTWYVTNYVGGDGTLTKVFKSLLELHRLCWLRLL